MNRVLCVLLLSCTHPLPPQPPDRAGSAAITDPHGAWFIDEENDAVLFAGARGGVTEYPCRWPSQLVSDSRGNVYGACRGEGMIRRFTDPPEAWPVGPEPRSLALDDDRRHLYVGLATANEVLMLDADTGDVLRRRDTDAEPTAIALLGARLVVGSRKSAVLELFPRELETEADTLALQPPNGGSLGVEHLVPARDALVAIAPAATLGQLQQPTYYSNFNTGAVVQQLFVLKKDGTVDPYASLQLPDVANAVFVDHEWTGGILLLASRGLSEVHSVELQVRPEVRPVKRPITAAVWRFLPDGLVGITDDGQQSYAFTDSVRRIHVAPSTAEIATSQFSAPDAGPFMGRVAALEAPPSHLDSELAHGRQLFFAANDHHISAVSIACADCHRDGRDDGRTWAGQGTRRQTPMLAGRDIAHTAPYGWDGEYPTLERYIAFTIGTRLRGTGLKPLDLAALARYVREGLRPIVRAAPAPSFAAAHGRVLFESEALGCVTCHPADGAYTDGEKHDVRSMSEDEKTAWSLANDRPALGWDPLESTCRHASLSIL